MGGSDDPSNIIRLTIEEHAEAHKKLYEQYGHWQDKLAWKGLAGLIDKDEILIEIYKNRNYKSPSKEHREILRQYMTNRIVSQETKNKISKHFKGKPNKHMKKMNQIEYYCSVCDKSMNYGNFMRYHKNCHITGKPNESVLKGKTFKISNPPLKTEEWKHNISNAKKIKTHCCIICRKEFNPGNFKRHISSHRCSHSSKNDPKEIESKHSL